METKELLDSLKSEWEQFKSVDAERLGEIERLGGVTVETETKLAKIDAAMTEVELRFERLSLESKRNTDGPSLERKAFESWVSTGTVTPDERKDLTIIGDDSAAVLAPPEIVLEMVQAAQMREPLLSLVRTRQTKQNSISFPTRATLSNAVWDADQGDYTVETTAPAFDKSDINTYGSHAVVDIDAVSLEDTINLNLEADLIADWARAFAVLDGVAVVSGSGTGRPKGILTELTDVVERTTGAAGASITYDKLNALVDTLKTPYRSNASFVVNRLTMGILRGIKDTAGGYIWQPDATRGLAGSIVGYPYAFSENLAVPGANAECAIFGDFYSGYWLVNRLSVEVQRDPYTQWPHVRFKARRRVGGKVVLGEALKVYKCAAA